MKTFVIGVSALDTLIYMNDFPETITEDMSLWANHTFKAVGGTGAGKALALDALGFETTLVTELGKDESKDFILDYYQKNTDLNLKILEADVTTTHTNIMHGEGNRISIFTSSSKEVKFNPALEKDIQDSDVIFLNINDYCRAYIPLIKKHHKLTIVDIHDYDLGNPYHQDFIDAADILFVSGVNIKEQENFLKEYINGKQLVVITNGKAGSIAIDNNHRLYKQSIYPHFKYVDSNGAGDTFSVAFTMHYLENKSIEEALKFASIAGALTCSSAYLYHPDGSYKYIKSMM